MKKKILFILSAITLLITIMYAEYRYIMVNQIIYKVNDHCYQIEIFNHVDEYYVE